jgi:hypothetical protein
LDADLDPDGFADHYSDNNAFPYPKLDRDNYGQLDTNMDADGNGDLHGEYNPNLYTNIYNNVHAIILPDVYRFAYSNIHRGGKTYYLPQPGSRS